MTAFAGLAPVEKELTFVEFFAGDGNVWAAIRADNHPSVPIDISYMDSCGNRGNNQMDINSDAGLALAV